MNDRVKSQTAVKNGEASSGNAEEEKKEDEEAKATGEKDDKASNSV